MIDFNDDDIKEVMDITGYTKAKATKLFKEVAKDADDGEDDEFCSYDVIEIIKMEHKAKESGADKLYVKSEEKKPRAKREVKLDDVKVAFLAEVAELLKNTNAESISITNPQKEISFTMGGDSYSLNLVKHRPPKQKK